MAQGILLGFVIGIVALVIIVVIMMRSKMIVAHQSRFDFQTTIEKVEDAIKRAGWSLVDSKRLNENLEKHSVNFVPRVHLIKLCKANMRQKC